MDDLTTHLLERLGQVQRNLGSADAAPDNADARFADVLDSMGLVEFVALLAEDCGVRPAVIEACAGQRFGTVAQLAHCLREAGLAPRASADGAVSTQPGSLTAGEPA